MTASEFVSLPEARGLHPHRNGDGCHEQRGPIEPMDHAILSPAPRSTIGWFKASRHPDALALIRHAPLAMIVAYVIAHRAQWRSDFNPHNLAAGEAFLGDFANYGMTRQQYRTALRQLEKWNFATIRATHEGTIAKLTDSRLFEICEEQSNKQGNQRLTTKQPTPNHYQELKSIRAEEMPSPSRPSSTFGRLQTAERIATEHRLTALQDKAKRLAGDLQDRVQRETRPDDVAKLKRYREAIAELERALGYDLD